MLRYKPSRWQKQDRKAGTHTAKARRDKVQHRAWIFKLGCISRTQTTALMDWIQLPKTYPLILASRSQPCTLLASRPPYIGTWICIFATAVPRLYTCKCYCIDTIAVILEYGERFEALCRMYPYPATIHYDIRISSYALRSAFAVLTRRPSPLSPVSGRRRVLRYPLAQDRPS